MSAPDEQLRRAYAAYRRSHGPTMAERSAVWRGVTDRIAAGESGPSWVEPPAQSRGRARVVFVAAVGLAAALILWVSVDLHGVSLSPGSSASGSQAVDQVERDDAGHAAVVREAERERRTRSRSSRHAAGDDDHDSHDDNEAATVEASPPVVEAVEAVEPVEAVGKRRRVRRPAPVEPPPAAPEPEPEPEPVESDTVAETKSAEPAPIVAQATLLARARRAVQQGEPRRALALVAEHRRRFATGVLAPERDLLEIDVLCSLGKVDKARAAARRHAQRFPDSTWSARIARSCAAP